MAATCFGKMSTGCEGGFAPTGFGCALREADENTTSVVFSVFFAVLLAVLIGLGLRRVSVVLGLRLILAVLGILILGLALRPGSPLRQQ